MKPDTDEDALNDLDIGGRALRGGDGDDDDTVLKFGDDDQYEAKINDVLGQGSFGKVYRALDKKKRRYVAVKTEPKGYRATLPAESKNYDIIGPHREYRQIISILDLV